MDLRRLPAPFALAVALAAQVPNDSVLVLTTQSAFSPPECAFVDPSGGGVTPVPLLFGPLTFVPPAGIAADPVDAQYLWFLNGETSLEAGIRRVPIGTLALPSGPSAGAAWTQVGGTRIRVGANRVFTLRAGGIVEATPKTGGAPFQLLVRPDAVDIAVLGNLLYVACRDAADPTNPAPLLELDLQTGVQRTVGSYADVRRVAAADSFGLIALAIDLPGVLEVDAVNGAIVGGFPTPGPVEAVTYGRFGTLVYGVTRPGGCDVYSVLRSTPVFSSTQPVLIDLDATLARTASVVPYGAGCGAAAATAWVAPTSPRLGNTGFTLGLAGAPANLPIGLFLGESRLFASLLGGALPITLQPLANGCELLVDPLVPVTLVADAAGTASLPIPIPLAATLAGAEWVGQAFVFDPTVGPLSFAGTAGVALRLDF